jgi:hypothetical protein
MNGYVGFAGRKLIGLILCVAAMVLTGLVSLTICANDALEPTVATNLTIAIVGGIGTLYATFVGGNYGEHVAKNKYGVSPPSQPAPPQGPPDPEQG